MHMLGGDYKRDELPQAVDKPTITGDAIKHYMKLAPGKRAVVFCVSIEHSKHVVAQFQAAGIPSAHVDGETPTEERDEAVEKFRKGKIQVLSNVELFGEGFDLPSLEVAILLRPTASLGLFIQQTGRALRTSAGKETAIILDHAGNVSRHGLPDEERDWSLEGHQCKTKGEKSLSVRICPSCFGAQKSGRPVCSFCGFVFETKQRKVEHIDGELSEIDLDQLRRVKKSEQGRCSTLEELTELGKKRGYKFPYRWARFLFQARQRRKIGMNV
jgi:superfamily II DNA or RNA helicase